MTKTINLSGITAVKIKRSAYDMDRFCRVRNFSGSDIFASCENPECIENADGVRRISAGEIEIIDTENYDTIYLNGNGSVEIVTSAYAIFRKTVKGGGNGSGNLMDKLKISGHFAKTIIGEIIKTEE